MNYADIKQFDVANGTGVRVSIFVSGCTHHCKGCFNPDTWDFGYGKPFTDVEIEHIIDSCKEDYIAGLSLLGGEPMEYVNQQGLLPLARRFKETYPDKTIWRYTGYTFDTDLLNRMCNEWNTPGNFSLISTFLWMENLWRTRRISPSDSRDHAISASSMFLHPSPPERLYFGMKRVDTSDISIIVKSCEPLFCFIAELN